MLTLSSGGRKISLTDKTINRDNAVVLGTPSDDHIILISMEKFKLGGDHGNYNRDQMDNIGVSKSLKPEATYIMVMFYLRVS